MTDTSIDRRVSRLEHDVQQLKFSRETLRGEIGSVGAAVDLTYHAVQALDERVEGLHSDMRESFAGVDTRFAGVEGRLAGIEGTLAEILLRLPPAQDTP